MEAENRSKVGKHTSEGRRCMVRKPVVIRDLTLGEGRPKICIPLVGEKEKDIIEQAKKLRDYPCDIVELRADWYEYALEAKSQIRLLHWLRDEDVLGSMPILYTFRTKQEGGQKKISFEQYRNLLLEISRSHLVDLLDVEGFMKEADRIKDLVDEIHGQGLPMILSSHDFEKTDETVVLIDRMRKLQSLGGDIVKIAVMPEKKVDVLRLLSATITMAEKYAKVPLITMSMSDQGRISRLCGEWTGSCLTFGTAGKSSAPGQWDARDLDTILSLLHS